MTSPPPPRGPLNTPPSGMGFSNPGNSPRVRNWEIPSNLLSYVLLAIAIASSLFAVSVAVFYALSYLDVTAVPGINSELIGYALGGIVGPIVLGINAVTQRRALQDPNYFAPYSINRAIRLIVIAGIVAAVVIAVALANDLDGLVTGWLIERSAS